MYDILDNLDDPKVGPVFFLSAFLEKRIVEETYTIHDSRPAEIDKHILIFGF
jgi:hypothetical protein